MKAKQVILNGIKTHLLIYEDGRLWSTKRHRFLSPQVHYSGYIWYGLKYLLDKNYYTHTLVALHFIGPKPTPKHEINHKDLDKRNNHWWNLEWVTHSENMLHARAAKHWGPGRRGFKHSPKTLAKMRVAKLKPVKVFKDGEEMYFGNIGEFCSYFKTYRRHFNRIVNSIHKIDGWSIRYA